MRNVINVSLIALALGVGFAACDRVDNRKRTETPPATTTSPSMSMSSADLENAVKAKLNADEKLRNLNVNADADKKEVTLSGTVESQELRDKAIDLAKSAQSGVTVNDKIDIKPAA